MEDHIVGDHMDAEVAHDVMWSDDNRQRKTLDKRNEVTINGGEPQEIDLEYLYDMTDHCNKSSFQLANLVKLWEYKQANAVRLLGEELVHLSKQREEVELRRLDIIEEHRFEEEHVGTNRHPVVALEELYDLNKTVPPPIHDSPAESKELEIDDEYDTIVYWKQRAMLLEKMLKESRQREQILLEKLDGSLKNMEKQSAPVEELSQMLKRADNFVHFILHNAPIVLGHLDKELRYRFIYNHFLSIKEEEIIGKMDSDIFSGAGGKECLDFKREVLERGMPGKREITVETELLGSKTFLIYAEPVFNKVEETIGVNYIGIDITDQVKKREKLAKLREEIAVQKILETELNKTMHIAEETMRAKQLLATMSHEIRSPLSGVVNAAEVLATTRLDKEQQEWLDVMISSGEWVLQLINNILDLSKAKSGVMKFEATKFRPRKVVRHVLQTAVVSLKKMLMLEGSIAENVPTAVIGDALRIRQVLTNLVSNAIKFTHGGKVGIRLYLVPAPYSGEEDRKSVETHTTGSREIGNSGDPYGDANAPYEIHQNFHEPRAPNKDGEPLTKDELVMQTISYPATVWIRCDVYDTGIGIPEHALPTLFQKYMQASVDHARKYGGTGLGLSICKELVEQMGGHMSVSSKENFGSTFSFILPYRVSHESGDNSDDPDGLPDSSSRADAAAAEDDSGGYFQFQPHTLISMTPDIISVSESSTALKKELGLQQASPESFLRHGVASEISGNNEECVDDTSALRSLGKIQSSLDMEVVSCTNGGQEQKTLHDVQEEQPMKQKYGPILHSTASSYPEVDRDNQKLKILVVEDEKVNLMVTTSMIKRLGHNIDIVNNGIEAIRAVQNHTYDLILMDVCMPDMDGLQATRIIRSYEKTGNWDAAANAKIDQPMHLQNSSLSFHDSSKRIPIIAMTANAFSESADECYASGMDSFVSKPFTFQKLRECLQRFLP